jgi:hypothetical protein
MIILQNDSQNDLIGTPKLLYTCKVLEACSVYLQPQLETDVWGCAVESFMKTDRDYLLNDSGANRDDGCTAVTAVLVGQKLIVANVGDSRAVLSRGGKGGHFPLKSLPRDDPPLCEFRMKKKKIISFHVTHHSSHFRLIR